MAEQKAAPAGDMPQALSSRERYSRMHVELRRRICLLDAPPGTRLSEETLAAEFGTSRNPDTSRAGASRG